MLFEKVIDYCRKNNLSVSAFEKKCNIGNGTVGRWKHGNSKPSFRTLEKISCATGISVSEWMEKEI